MELLDRYQEFKPKNGAIQPEVARFVLIQLGMEFERSRDWQICFARFIEEDFVTTSSSGHQIHCSSSFSEQ